MLREDRFQGESLQAMLYEHMRCCGVLPFMC